MAGVSRSVQKISIDRKCVELTADELITCTVYKILVDTTAVAVYRGFHSADSSFPPLSPASRRLKNTLRKLLCEDESYDREVALSG